MSTEVKSHTNNFTITRFFGGAERGTCIQITDSKTHGNIQVTKDEAMKLAIDLIAFADNTQEDLE